MSIQLHTHTYISCMLYVCMCPPMGSNYVLGEVELDYLTFLHGSFNFFCDLLKRQEGENSYLLSIEFVEIGVQSLP